MVRDLGVLRGGDERATADLCSPQAWTGEKPLSMSHWKLEFGSHVRFENFLCGGIFPTFWLVVASSISYLHSVYLLLYIN